jgi:hypothetical protein
MPRFADKRIGIGIPVTIDRDRYIEGDVDATIEGSVVLGEKPGNTMFPIQLDVDGYLRIYLDGDPVLQTEHLDNALNGASLGTLVMGDDGTNLQNISVDVNGYLQIEVVGGGYSDIQYEDSEAVALPFGTVTLGHDGSNVFPVIVDSSGHLRVSLVEVLFFNSVADVTLVATSVTQITEGLVSRLNTLIKNKRTNIQTFRIGDSNVGATRGAELAPGESIVIETTEAIYGYNPGGSSEKVSVVLREEDDNPEPPTIPVLISPIDGVVVANTSVTFQWDSCVGATNYHIRVSTDPDVETDLFHEDWTGATSKNYTNFPNDGTTYYWKVRAYNAIGWSDWSTIENFVNGEEAGPPDAPILISPTNGSDVSSTSVTFQWNSSEGATNYQIRVSVDPNVEDPLFHDDTTSNTSKNYTDFPNDGTVYYWKVRAYNDAGWGSWSTIWSFSNGDDGVPTIESGHSGYYDLDPEETKYFKFQASVNECIYPIQVGNTPQSGQSCTVRMIIKRGEKPTISDYDLLQPLGSFVYDCGDERYYPEKPEVAADYFWRFNTGSNGEYVEIGEPHELTLFYIMLYNNGAEAVDNQRLTLNYWE